MTGKTIQQQLIDAVKSKPRSAWGGLRTADEYACTVASTLQPLGMFLSGSDELANLVKETGGKLTHSDDSMIVEEKAPKIELPDGVELPKNTLMVFRHVITSDRKDRDGDVLRPDGATIDPKMLLLWQHIPTLPIGKMLAIDVQNSNMIRLVSVIVDMNPLSHDAAVMIDNKMGRFSHGFVAREFEELKGPDATGFDVKVWEMLEESLVSIPSNIDAEQEDILLSLVGKKQLTNPIITQFAKSLQEARDVSVAFGEVLTQEESLTLEEDLTVGESQTKELDKIETQREVGDAQLYDSTYKHKTATSPSTVGLDGGDRLVVGEEQGLREDKAGRVLSKRNLEALVDVKEDLAEIKKTDGMTRAGKALCERCIGKLASVIKDASPADPEENPKLEDKPEEKPDKTLSDCEAAVIVLQSSDEQLLRQVRDSLDAVVKTIDGEKAGKEFRELVAT